MASITTILSPKPLCPVVDGDGVARNCFYQPKDLVIWSNKSGAASSVPAVLSHLNPSLQVVIDQTGIYALTAQINGQAIISPMKITSSNQVTVTLSGAKVPRWIVGQVNWELTNLATKKVTTLQTKLEVYVVHDPVPPFFDNQGIPLSLLRFLPKLPHDWLNRDQAWAAFIVDVLFINPWLEYDVFKGVSKYTSWDQMPYDFLILHGVVLNCWLELFLSDMHGAVDRNDNTKYAINCYDMTALVQTFIALGTNFAAIRAKYMEPVGFIKATHLIGRSKDTTPSASKNPLNLCNNPFFGCPSFSKEMLCDAKDKNRSKIENHMFLTQDDGSGPVVLDACCGPEAGARLLSAYAAGILDPSVPDGPDAEGGIYVPGTLADILDGPGVSALAVSAFIGRGFPFLDQLTKRLSEYGTLLPPCFGLPYSDGAVTLTSTFIPNPDLNIKDDTWTINIFRFEELDKMQANFNDRADALEQTFDLGSNEIVNLTCRGGFRMFANSTHNVMGIVESRLASSPNLGQVCQAIEALVKEFKPLEDIGLEKLVPPDRPLHVGERFSLTIKTGGGVHDWWKGYAVDTTYGNALFINTGKDEHGDDSFNFIARRPGADNIAIILIGPYLEGETRRCGVLIQ